jgi:hypothetical protein
MNGLKKRARTNIRHKKKQLRNTNLFWRGKTQILNIIIIEQSGSWALFVLSKAYLGSLIHIFSNISIYSYLAVCFFAFSQNVGQNLPHISKVFQKWFLLFIIVTRLHLRHGSHKRISPLIMQIFRNSNLGILFMLSLSSIWFQQRNSVLETNSGKNYSPAFLDTSRTTQKSTRAKFFYFCVCIWRRCNSFSSRLLATITNYLCSVPLRWAQAPWHIHSLIETSSAIQHLIWGKHRYAEGLMIV